MSDIGQKRTSFSYMTQPLKIQTASDVIRDGLGCELTTEAGDVVAEVFRCDANRSVVVTTFGHDVPLDAMERLIAFARKRLEPFESGEPLNTAANFKHS